MALNYVSFLAKQNLVTVGVNTCLWPEYVVLIAAFSGLSLLIHEKQHFFFVSRECEQASWRMKTEATITIRVK